jgi:hypothetical protein
MKKTLLTLTALSTILNNALAIDPDTYNKQRALKHTLTYNPTKIGTMERIDLRPTAKLPAYSYILEKTGYNTYTVKTPDGQQIGTYRIIDTGYYQLRIAGNYARLKLGDADRKYLKSISNSPELMQNYINNLNSQLRSYGYQGEIVQRKALGRTYYTIKLRPLELH